MKRFYATLTSFTLLLTSSSLSAKTQQTYYCESIGEGPGYVHHNARLGGLSPARIDTCGDWDICLSGSFIYWNIMQENMGIASLQTGDSPQLALTTYQQVDFQPGFKVTLSSNVSGDDWIGKAEYTRLHGDTTTETAPPPNGNMVVNPGFTSPGAVNRPASFVTSNFKVSLDTIDLLLTRPSYVSHLLIFTPYVGSKFGFIDQHLRTATLLNLLGTQPIPAQFDTDTWFVGPKLGMDLEWILGSGFKSFSAFSLSLLYQRQKLHADFYNSTNVNDNNLDLQRTYRFFRPNLQMALGLSWGTYFLDKALHARIFAAYEVDYYMAQNVAKSATLENFYATSSPSYSSVALGDLVFHGLTTGLSFDF
ncbi:MAG: Lpg1974 family pore-forming outer membrane protein [Chlamydiota bacterium]